jgi:hypothetical protein
MLKHSKHLHKKPSLMPEIRPKISTRKLGQWQITKLQRLGRMLRKRVRRSRQVGPIGLDGGNQRQRRESEMPQGKQPTLLRM